MPTTMRQLMSMVPANQPVEERAPRSRFSDQSLEAVVGKKAWLSSARAFSSKVIDSPKTETVKTAREASSKDIPIINTLSHNNHATHVPSSPTTTTITQPPALADELDYITVTHTSTDPPDNPTTTRHDKASRILGIRHRRSMEPIPASARNSIISTRSEQLPREQPTVTHVPNLPLTSLYVVSGLPKSPHTWTLADPDSVMGLHHSEGAVNRWWRPEVLGSTVSPGAGGGKKKRRGKGEEVTKGAGALSKREVGKMLSKTLKLSFTREVEVIASTLQPASTIHTFTFTLPAPSTPLAPAASGDLLRASVLSTADNRSSAATFAYPYSDDPFARPSSAYLGPPSILARGSHNTPGASGSNGSTVDLNSTSNSNNITYYGVCLTVWSHADAERGAAIHRTLEAGRSRKQSAQSVVASRLRHLRSDLSGSASEGDPSFQARKQAKKSARGPWGDAETDPETEAEGAISESDFEVASTIGHGPGQSTLFLPGDTVFWLPYALTLVSRHPVYDLMRDYLTLSWARFSKDVQSHTLQISKILAHPAPRAGELIKLDASPKTDGGDSNLEVIARFPGGLDFGRGLVDINFTMWPLFKCMNIDNILTLCEIALAPTGRVLFFSRYPAMLGIAVNTLKYLVELRAWNGIALPAVHSRDAKIYIDDPGPWIMGLSTEARYSIRPSPEVCVCDLDINYLSCPSPPPGAISVKQQREKYRQRLIAAFESHYHPDHCIPSEFKEAFPAGRFRPVCKIQAKRGASSAAVADQIKPPDWWHSTRIIQAFDAVLQDKFKKPSLLKRMTSFGSPKRAPQLTVAEQHIQLSIRKRATAFVDARDELETKIGRLSRRLNFLMTESDLWRDKFANFEQYAQKLSNEATQMRAKINKEQREAKRLSGLVSLTAAEKSKLQAQLRETESQHKDAMVELQRMRQAMEKMEMERAEMIAEVEAQIEKALESMAVDIDDSDYASSRPQSRLSSRSLHRTRSRCTSDAQSRGLRSFATDSTLAESYGQEEIAIAREARGEQFESAKIADTIVEEEEEQIPIKKKRFSASEMDVLQDGMSAVDEGISIKSDLIAQKVLEIQQKLDDALSKEKRGEKKYKSHSSMHDSGPDDPPPRPPRASKRVASRQSNRGTRARSDTASSNQTSTPTILQTEESFPPSTYSRHRTKSLRSSVDLGSTTPTGETFDASEFRRSQETTEPVPDVPDLPAHKAPEKDARRRSALNPKIPASVEDSDNDFQSAYSASPRDSRFGNFDEDADVDSSDFETTGLTRLRTASAATAAA